MASRRYARLCGRNNYRIYRSLFDDTEGSMTIAPVIMLVIHLQGSYIVQFYDMTACVRAKDEIKKVERSLVTKCLATVTVEKKPDI